MKITATELKLNLGRYLKLSETEDVYITKNGKVIARLSNPNLDKLAIVDSLIGILPPEASLEKAREERLSKI